MLFSSMEGELSPSRGHSSWALDSVLGLNPPCHQHPSRGLGTHVRSSRGFGTPSCPPWAAQADAVEWVTLDSGVFLLGDSQLRV